MSYNEIWNIEALLDEHHQQQNQFKILKAYTGLQLYIEISATDYKNINHYCVQDRGNCVVVFPMPYICDWKNSKVVNQLGFVSRNELK